jgi:hypothetical protein
MTRQNISLAGYAFTISVAGLYALWLCGVLPEKLVHSSYMPALIALFHANNIFWFGKGLTRCWKSLYALSADKDQLARTWLR